MATKTDKSTPTVSDVKRMKNEIEDIFETLRDQEEKLSNLYDLEAAAKVLATSINSMVHDIVETNEDLYSKVREISVIIDPEKE